MVRLLQRFQTSEHYRDLRPLKCLISQAVSLVKRSMALHSRSFAHALDIGMVLGLSGASGRSDHARQVVSFFEVVENGVSHCFHARLNRYRDRESRIVF